MKQKTMKQQTSLAVTFLLWMGMCVAGCSQEETDSLIPGLGDNSAIGDPVAFSISLQGNTEYNAVSNKDANAPDTRSERALIGEWVKVNSFSATRSADEYEGPAMAAMDLTEDGPATSAPGTRAVMPAGYYFRVIAFRKVGSTYVYHSAADYTADGTNAPVLKQGNINLRPNLTYRFVAYSFNNNAAMGALPSSYTWGGTPISIPNLNNDFMTFDSRDKSVTTAALALPVSFTHQLCRLTVKISATGFTSNTFSNCTGVYVAQGGNSSSWPVGAGSITPNTGNSTQFVIPNGNTATFTRLVPFAAARPITVHFGTLTVGDKAANNINITSSQSVQLLLGRSYTMTVQFKKVGINVPAADINLTQNGCTSGDKTELAKLTWAEGNLKSTGGKGSGNYVWTTNTDYGYYYTWNSAYTGNTSSTSSDPCKELNVTTYGTGWVTPNKVTMERLSRCTNKILTNKGMWFMNNPKGLFLPAAGFRLNNEGSGTTAANYTGAEGHYWSSESDGSSNGYRLYYYSGSASLSGTGARTHGFSVRCVKGI